MLSFLPPVIAPQSPDTVKVAAIQCSSDMGTVDANRKKLMKLTEEAAAKGAKFIVLPEAAITGYLSQDLRINWHLKDWPLEPNLTGKDPKGFAETVPGPSTKAFAELAKKLEVYITVPFVEVDDKKAKTPKYFNTVCLVSPKGEVVAHYRKLTPWPVPEKSWATKGDRDVQTYDTEYGRVGLAICFDIHTILEKYKPKKIWTLLYPIAWVSSSHPADWFYHTLPARIKPFGHNVVGANWSVDKAQPWYGYGFSTIYDAEGKIVSTAHSIYGSTIVYADLKTAAK